MKDYVSIFVLNVKTTLDTFYLSGTSVGIHPAVIQEVNPDRGDRLVGDSTRDAVLSTNRTVIQKKIYRKGKKTHVLELVDDK